MATPTNFNFCLLSSSCESYRTSDCRPLNHWIAASVDGHVFKDVRVFFSGRIDNLHQLHCETRFDDQSAIKTEEILAALYLQDASAMQQQLQGAYCIVIVDADRIVLMRDEKGLEPLYMYQRGSAFAISNSIATMRHYVPLKLSELALTQYLVLHRLSEGFSMFEQTRSLAPGQTCVVTVNGDCRVLASNAYEFAEEHDLEKSSDKTILNLIDQTLGRSIETSLESVPPHQVINTLSGGVDSSLLQCFLHERSYPRSVCSNFSELGIDADYANDIAQALDLQHEVVSILPTDLLSSLQAGIRATESPAFFAGDAFFYPMYQWLRKNHALEKPLYCFDSTGSDTVFATGNVLRTLCTFEQSPRIFHQILDIARKHLNGAHWTSLHEVARRIASNTSLDASLFGLLSGIQSAKEFSLDPSLVRRALESTFESFEPVIRGCSYSESMWRSKNIWSNGVHSSRMNYLAAKQEGIVYLHPFRSKELVHLMSRISVGRKLKRFTGKYYARTMLAQRLSRKFAYRKKTKKNIPLPNILLKQSCVAEEIANIKDAKYPYFDIDLSDLFQTQSRAFSATKILNFHIWYQMFLAPKSPLETKL